MKYLLIFLIPISLFASKILSYNIYNRTDRVDVMITFDTPYDGVIKEKRVKSKMIIKLEKASIESSKIKKISSTFIQSLVITPMHGYTQMVASVPSSTKLLVSKTTDSYGLRLRFIKGQITKNNESELSENNSLSLLPTKKGEDISMSYYIVIALMLVGIIILFMLKRKIESKTKEKTTNSWLFKDNKERETKTGTTGIEDKDNNISIRFQKTIDDKNSVVMLDFAEQSYLVIIGNSNILLDKFTDNRPNNQEDFESILQNRHQELDDFLRVENNTKQTINNEMESLQTYKERASYFIYNE